VHGYFRDEPRVTQGGTLAGGTCELAAPLQADPQRLLLLLDGMVLLLMLLQLLLADLHHKTPPSCELHTTHAFIIIIIIIIIIRQQLQKMQPLAILLLPKSWRIKTTERIAILNTTPLINLFTMAS
jgi:hypothetical protein